MRRVVLTWGAAVILLAGVPTASAAQSPGSILASALSRGMRHIGGASGAYVVDLTTGQALFSQAAGVQRMPASVEKLYTTSTALLRFGPGSTLTTSVLGSGTLDSSGVWHGVFYLRGGGDPTFGAVGFDHSAYGTGATMQRLVSNLLRGLHITAVQGRIVGDESYFDSLRGTPSTAYHRDLNDNEGLLSGLAYDRGFANFTGTIPQLRPALYATSQFASALRAAGVKVPANTPIYTGRTPVTAQRLAIVKSPSMARLIQLTNTPSDNYLAEMLLKGLGARFGVSGTTSAGAAVVRAELASTFGIAPRLIDGSGLSRTDATSPRQVGTLLAALYSNSDFFNSLAVGGETGTLQHEMRRTPARGDCCPQTDTLN